MDDNVPGFIKITDNGGFNYLATQHGPIEINDELFLRRNGEMIPLGTYRQAKARVIDGSNNVMGIDRTDYGNFGDPIIDDNLFILYIYSLPRPPVKNTTYKPPRHGGFKHRKTRSRKYRSKKSRSRRVRHR